MKIIVDQNIRIAEATFGAHATLEFMDGRAIRHSHLRNADALIVRTTTRVDESLLRGTPVRFVGSTTIGTDHLDTTWMEAEGISWANAPGCNADSAAQYTLAMIWLALERLQRPLHGLSAGIIGRGHVGSRVQQLLGALGVDSVCNDPPLQDLGVSGLVALEAALDNDIVCVHVPLTKGGPYPTHQLVNRRRLACLPDRALLVNTSRGDVIAGRALLHELQTNRLSAALDVWPREPAIDPALLGAVTVATPHVAGYSDDGKRAGTLQVYAVFCGWAGVTPVTPPPPPEPRHLDIAAGDEAVTRALDSACFVRRQDAALRRLQNVPIAERAAGFDRLRKDYPPRRDFQAWRVAVGDPAAAKILRQLGFQVSSRISRVR
ncbi:MAG: 4-phosphoerythronate dehydrogenase [Xanthomonadales bacterium]|nr:4-phosphoerythronate dehydrogenase [Xanthomonadales bacterium]